MREYESRQFTLSFPLMCLCCPKVESELVQLISFILGCEVDIDSAVFVILAVY